MIYYVYAFIDPRKKGTFIYDGYSFDFEPFYIGKGSNNRIQKHNQYLKNDDTLKYKKFRKIIKDGLSPIIIKIAEILSEKDSFELESKLINLIGRINLNSGTLCNLTQGGEGSSGRECNLETRTKISNSVKNCGRVYTPHSEEFKKRMSSKFRGRISPSKGRKLTIDEKERISKAQYKIVIQYDLNNNFIKEYEGIKIASIETGVSKSNISKNCNGWTKSAGGYIWQFK